MGRKRLPEEERRESVSLRLPKWLIEKVSNDGKIQEVIENLLTKIYKRKK